MAHDDEAKVEEGEVGTEVVKFSKQELLQTLDQLAACLAVVRQMVEGCACDEFPVTRHQKKTLPSVRCSPCFDS